MIPENCGLVEFCLNSVDFLTGSRSFWDAAVQNGATAGRQGGCSAAFLIYWLCVAGLQWPEQSLQHHVRQRGEGAVSPSVFVPTCPVSVTLTVAGRRIWTTLEEKIQEASVSGHGMRLLFVFLDNHIFSLTYFTWLSPLCPLSLLLLFLIPVVLMKQPSSPSAMLTLDLSEQRQRPECCSDMLDSIQSCCFTVLHCYFSLFFVFLLYLGFINLENQ